MSRLTCTDCIHDYVCHNLNNLNYWNKDDPNGDPMDKFCLCFKNKELFIELPCKVGDTVWIVGTKCLSGQYELKCNEIASCDDCPLNHEFVVFDRKFDWRLFSIMQRNELHKEGRRLFVWGETVFVTKEDAEAKLAEVKGGEL